MEGEREADPKGMEAAFVRTIIDEPVLVKPHLLGSNVREIVAAHLRSELEGVCSRHGYVMPGSVSVHKMTNGRIEAVSLNGDVRYDVKLYANVCNPPVGAVLPARVVSVNKFGVLAQCGLLMNDGAFVPVIEVIVMKQGVNGAPSEIDLEALKQGDEIHVELLGKKFELNDDKISGVGRAVASAASSASSSAPVRVLPAMYDAVDDLVVDELIGSDSDSAGDGEEGEEGEEEKEGVSDDDDEDGDDDEDDVKVVGVSDESDDDGVDDPVADPDDDPDDLGVDDFSAGDDDDEEEENFGRKKGAKSGAKGAKGVAGKKKTLL